MSDPERTPVIYIAGPYRAPTPWQILANIRAAQAVALEVWRLGAVALCPHANTALFDGEAPDEVWLSGDLELLRRCDGVVAVKGYLDSRGAVAELKFAEELGLPVFFDWPMDTVLKGWIDGWKRLRRLESGRDAEAADHKQYLAAGPPWD